MLGLDVRAAQVADFNALLRRLPFLADGLALARCQRTQKIIESAIITVFLVELDILPPEPAGLLKQSVLRGIDKCCMGR